MDNRVLKRVINKDKSLLQALKQMDAEEVKLLLVFEADRFLGILTIGDIQRAIIRNSALSDPISSIIDKNKTYGFVTESEEEIKGKMRRMRAELMPILNKNGELVDVVFWEDYFGDNNKIEGSSINLPVVIMAGGRGTRLKPLTNVIPKPMIPIGEKTILEEIMDRFESIGCRKFYLSVDYKSEMLRYYLEHLEHKYDIDFLEEDKPLGTIGSVSLLKGKVTTPFFVSNCDIVIDQDMRDVYDYHIENNNDITVVSAVKSISIPYGVIETGENGLMKEMKEKPELTYMVNTGVYIMNPDCITGIPEGEFFHITQLMEEVKNNGGRVGCFPVSGHAWKDMGEWTEYLKMIDVY
jgi:dTDP-glucose pyrophosphorylase